MALEMLVVEAHGLDSDEQTRLTYEVEPPTDTQAWTSQVTGLVAHAHPDARLQEIDGRVATFVDRGRLIIARFLERSPARAPDQDQLFAA